jgi:predicted DsbA family dithiol-disulfide isomerase
MVLARSALLRGAPTSDIPPAVAPHPASDGVSLVLHGDVLDPWCWIAEKRIVAASEELHGRFAPLRHAPLPRRWHPRAPTAAERRYRVRELKRAAREPDAPPFSPELWEATGGPQSSAPPLIALAAARLQGRNAEVALREALRTAALVAGIDVSRSDVIVEVAARAGLDLARFVPAFQAPGTERTLLAELCEARELGVERGPALVVNEDWLVTGSRSLRDYRVLLKRYLTDRVGSAIEHTVH